MTEDRPIRMTINEARICVDTLRRVVSPIPDDSNRAIDKLYCNLVKQVQDENDALEERHKAKQS